MAEDTVRTLSPGASSPQPPVPPPPQDLRVCLKDADELKQEGNDYFRAKRWDEALATYRSALGHLPRRPIPLQKDMKGKGRGLDDNEDEGADSQEDSKPDPTPTEEEIEEQAPPTELDIESAKARAILNANIGACYAKLGEYKDVVAACTEALKDDPKYVKALQRRAEANEQINSWSSLASALEDHKTLLQLIPTSERVGTRRKIGLLEPRVEAAQKRETGEMLDKLKGLGNSILGNFGLSTDNFQFVPNGQGGYSMNFTQNP